MAAFVFTIFQAGRIVRSACLPVVLVFLATSGLAQEREYRLGVKAEPPAIQVDGNTQIKLTIFGLKLSDLTKAPLEGLDPGREVLLSGNIGYEPRTPGIKKIGPFELEFQGELLRSEIIMVEAVPGWPPGKEGYQFQIFPRTVVKGEPIRVTLRQQYSGAPLVDMTRESSQTTVRFSRQSNGEQRVEVKRPPRPWYSAGSSAMLIDGKSFQMTSWWCDIPTPEAGKFSITRENLPPLPADVVFEPVEVEVVERKDDAPQASAQEDPRPAGANGARLILNAQPRTIMFGDGLHLGVLLNGVKVADLGEKALPGAPQPYEWSQEIQFYSDLEFTPKTSGEKTFGPFAVEFQGERLVSNSQTVEVVPEWPRDAERYEFRVFPRTVVQGTPIRVTYREQYSAKPHLDIPYNNPRSPNSKLWGSPGIRSWMEGGRKFSRMVSTFDIPSNKVGKMVITREDLPPMDASIPFEPIEVEVTEAK